MNQKNFITQWQIENILIDEGIILPEAIDDSEGYDGGKIQLAIGIATKQVNELIAKRINHTHQFSNANQNNMYIYIKTERMLWTVGFYDPDGKWHSDSDHNSPEEAAERVHYLNGGK